MQLDQNTLQGVTITDAREQKPAPKAAEKTKRTPEQEKLWTENKDKIHARMFPNAKPEAAKPAAKDAAKPADAKEKPAAKDAATEAAKEPADDGKGKQEKPEAAKAPESKAEPPAKKEEPAPSVDYAKLAETVANATAKAIKDNKEPATAKPDEDVPAARRRDLDAIEYLATTDPAYKAKAAEYRKFAKAEVDYVAKWERENPGQSFDGESDEHSAWYDKHKPEIDADAIEEARIELITDRKAKALLEKESGSTRKEIESIRLERDIERAEAAVPHYFNRGVAIIANALGEDVAKAFTSLKENETLEASDPAAHNAISAMIPELDAQTKAATRIFGTEGRAFNPKDETHQAVAKEAMALQDLIAAQPADKQVQGGKRFAKLDEWANLTPEQKAQRWTINPDLMSQHLAYKAAQKAAENYKTEREKVEKLATAYGYQKIGASAAAQTAHNEKPAETATEREKPRSPSTSSATVIQPGNKAVPKNSKDTGDVILDKMFRR
jgi:hypothetical protein